MIEVKNLTKRYGSNLAIDNLNFEVKQGEIVGFLGANGAGKTTTMRILTCYIPATQGDAYVAGYNVFTNPKEVRQNIGYLPESVPLYSDMRVFEYLVFRSQIKGFSSSDAKKTAQESMERCWITDVKDKIIGNLSKGYRQRVAFADAILNNPKILILDEPTVGLDPNQIIKVRELIKELGKSHTIFLSSHILPEVEMVCSKVIIIHQGRIVAQDTTAALKKKIVGSNKVYAQIKSNSKEKLLNALNKIEGVLALKIEDKDIHFEVEIDASPNIDIREQIFSCAVENKFVLKDLHVTETCLEDVFIHITTKEHNGGKEGQISE